MSVPFSLYYSVIGFIASQDMAERIIAAWFLLGQDQVSWTQHHTRRLPKLP